MNDYLLTIKDICDILKVGEKSARKILERHRCTPINLGPGRSLGKRWLYSQIQELLQRLSDESQPKKTVRKSSKTPLGLGTMELKDLQKILSR